MSKTNVKVKLDGLKIIKKLDHNFIAGEVVGEMKNFITTGVSPVKGVGRFTPYKATRASNEVKQFSKTQQSSRGGYYRRLAKVALSKYNFYPNSVRNKYPSKTITPVNLYLSGEFLNSLTHRALKTGSEIGHINPSARTRNLFEAHNEGLNKNVPQRRYLPVKRGEKFVVSIMRLIKDLYAANIKAILKK